MSTASQQTPRRLLAQLRGFRRHVVVLKITEVLVAATFGLLAAWLVVMIVERFTELASWQRLVLLVVGVVGFAVALPRALYRWVWRTRHIKNVAQLLSSRFPLLSDEIISVLELSTQKQRGASAGLIAAAMEQTGQDAHKKNFMEAAPSHRWKTWALLTAAVLVATVVSFTLIPAAATNAWQRFLNPWTQTSRFTFTQIAPLPQRQVVSYGEEFLLNVSLLPESDVQPETATATLGRATVTAKREDNGFTFSMPGQTASGELTVKAGDSASCTTIVPKTRPELVEVVADLDLPAYLEISESKQLRSLNGRFRIVKGSQASFTVFANRELCSASMDQQPIATTESSATTGPLTIDQDQHHELQWQDEFGMTASAPITLDIDVLQDRKPNCTLQRIKQRVVMLDQSINLAFSAADDFGLRYVGIQWQGRADAADNPNPAQGEKILFAGGPNVSTIQAQGVLAPLRENIAPQFLTLKLFTEDFGGQREYSLPQTVHVMSAQQHVAWVTEQMKRWKSRSDAIYERELALNGENKRLQSLTYEELATNENIRRLEEQAAAERDNSERLKLVIEQGRQLIQQALRNKNMRADQVGRWSESLARLKAVAGNRMEELSRRLSRLADELSYRAENDDQVSDAILEEQQSADEKRTGAQRGQNNNQKPTSGDGKAETGSPDRDDPQSPSANDAPPEEEDKKEKAPNLAMEEKSMHKKKDASQHKDPKKPGDSNDSKEGGNDRLTIPESQLLNPEGLDKKKENEESTDPDAAKDKKESPTQPQRPEIDGIVEDHEQLLEEFRKARDAMDDLLAEFENSTFVKRLKAAAQSQLSVAARLNGGMANLFGVSHQPQASDAKLLSELSEAQGIMFDQMSTIEADLKAYQSREPDEKREQVLDDMQTLNMRVKLEEMPIRLRRKFNGDTLHRTEFWADTFDRWAEELVPPQRSNGPDEGNGGGGGGKKPNLPPAIVLEIMRLINDQTQLRDETRTLDQARNAMSETEVDELLGGVTIYQLTVNERALDAMEDVRKLPNSTQNFDEEIKKLGNALEAMGDASAMLVDAMTGEPTIAAETTAIEALLAARRSNRRPEQAPKDRKKGAGDGSESLAGLDSPFDILRSDDGQADSVKPRDVGAALGSSSDGVPDAYRSGLNSFQNQLRKLDQMQQ